jgi:hypothetical protein
MLCMAIQTKEQRWAEVHHVAGGTTFLVRYGTWDLGDGKPIVPALEFEVPRDRDCGNGIFSFAVEDLRELVRLADEEKGLLGG